LNNLNSFLRDRYKTGLFVILVLHTVGLVGLLSPWYDVFLRLTPATLLVSVLLLIRGWEHISLRLWMGIAAVFALGWGVEYLGAEHGLVFGNYDYGTVLGPGPAGVPLLIGVNWVLVIFGAHALSSSFDLPAPLRIGLGAAFAVVLDVAIEPVAVHLGFWTWQNNEIPLSNYVGWFGVSALLIWAVERLVGPTRNGLARALFLVMFAFFGILAMIL